MPEKLICSLSYHPPVYHPPYRIPPFFSFSEYRTRFFFSLLFFAALLLLCGLPVLLYLALLPPCWRAIVLAPFPMHIMFLVYVSSFLFLYLVHDFGLFMCVVFTLY